MDTNKKPTLLLLGGSQQQVVAIEAAKECGFRTVLCDYLPDNPGQHHADVFYLVSTTDRQAVLEVAQAEQVDGVVAYSSDPAAPTAAHVAEQLGLPTNPLTAVETMSAKNLFRAHLLENGFPCPQAVSFSADAAAAEVELKTQGFRYPLVIKPTDSSGSKGVTVLSDAAGMHDAIAHAANNGRNGILIAEEYIEYGFPRVIGGDIFVVEGKVRFWGLMSCLRDDQSPLVPVGEITPSGMTADHFAQCKRVLQDLVTSLGINFGELNVEIILGTDGMPYVLELGSRAGGNMIPVQLSDASGIDLVKANVLCAMGKVPDAIDWEPDQGCYATYVLHSPCAGTFQGHWVAPEVQHLNYRTVMYLEPGAPVEAFNGANKALGILFFRFEDQQQLDDFTERFAHLVKINVV